MIDYSRQVLIEHLEKTNKLMNQLLSKIDGKSNATIIDSYELGFPNDVMRLAGGFSTGMYMEWKTDFPFIPIDTTVNVCSTTICELGQNVDFSTFSAESFDRIEKKILKSSFRFNFNRGNHFISYCRGRGSGKYFLILHSDAYNVGFDSINPEEENWYYSNIKTFKQKNRYIRYIIDDKARMYYELTKLNEVKNKIKHELIVDLLLRDHIKIKKINTFHHHFMPTENSIVIGGYLVSQNQTVPIMSYPGYPIFMYCVEGAKKFKYNIQDKILVPHGWGIGSNSEITFEINEDYLRINNHVLENKPGISLRELPEISLRNYGTTDEYLKILDNEYYGYSVDLLDQIQSFSKDGLISWSDYVE